MTKGVVMIELEKRVEEYITQKYGEATSIEDYVIQRSELVDDFVDFTKQEIEILELQKDKGRLTDELTEVKSLMRELWSICKVEMSPFTREAYKNIFEGIEAFLKE